MTVKLFGGNAYQDLNWWNFPAGERGVKILNPTEILRHRSMCIELHYTSDQDFMDMLLLVNALRNVAPYMHLWLKCPYFPYARQDRIMTEGESFSLQVAADLIKMANFESMEVWDIHSDVLNGMFKPGFVSAKRQEWLVRNLIPENLDNACLVSPDAGALKKIYKLAVMTGLPVVEARKVREVITGKVVETDIDPTQVKRYDTFVVVDDICDGGATFIELARAIEAWNPNAKLILITTHGIYSKGLAVLYEYYNEVYCLNDMRVKA